MYTCVAGALAIQGPKVKQPVDVDQRVDMQYMQDAFFSEVTGQRYKSSLAFVQEAKTHMKLLVFALSLEPLRPITVRWT